MKFRDFFSVKHILFAVCVLALFVAFAFIASYTQVEVTFEADAVHVDSNRYTMSIPYEMIQSTELRDLPEAGEKLRNGRDDETIRYGFWENDTWGKHHIIADLEAKNCIVIRTQSGEVFVFSCRDTEKTEELYTTLLEHLN